jgi:prepilin-type N-terminal cleavage/methylation domain-containing protein
VRGGLLREEGGFTLPELLVTMVMMLTVLFALYSIFDMSIRVFSFGNDKVEAVENARLGLEKMERELRAAYPYDKLDGNNTLLAARTPNSITFGNDLNGDREIDAADEPSEQITYNLSGGSPATLQRNSQPVVEFVSDVDGDGNALTFEYMDENEATVNAGDPETDISLVRIKLEVAVDRGIHEEPVTQVLETDVALRNRGG